MSKKPAGKGKGKQPKKFFGKHPPLREDKGGKGSFVDKGEVKRKSVQQVMAEMEKAKAKWHMNLVEAEKNLTEYLQTADPILARVDGEVKPIFWVRRPSMKEIKMLTPNAAQMKYMENPNEMPSDMQKEYDERFFGKFAELIVAPEKTPEQWRDVINPWILRLFWGYIAKVGNILGAEVEGF